MSQPALSLGGVPVASDSQSWPDSLGIGVSGSPMEGGNKNRPSEPAEEQPRLGLVPSLDEPEAESDAEGCVRCRGADAGSAEALPASDRRRPAADRRRGARARPAQGRGRRGGEAAPDRGQPAPGHVDHPQLHEGRGAAARPDPGGEPGPDARGREVRLEDGLQALHLRDLVDPPGGHARARRPGADDPPAGARRRAESGA